MNTIARDLFLKISEYGDFNDNLQLSNTCIFFHKNINLEKKILNGFFTKLDYKIANQIVKKLINQKNWKILLKVLPFVDKNRCLSFRLFREISVEESIELVGIIENNPNLIHESLNNPERLWKIYFYIAKEVLGFNLGVFKNCVDQCRLRGLDYLLVEENFLIDEEDIEYKKYLSTPIV